MRPGSWRSSKRSRVETIGITTETASRIMADFKRRDLVHSDTGNEVVCDHFGLAQLAESQAILLLNCRALKLPIALDRLAAARLNDCLGRPDCTLMSTAGYASRAD